MLFELLGERGSRNHCPIAGNDALDAAGGNHLERCGDKDINDVVSQLAQPYRGTRVQADCARDKGPKARSTASNF
ncbi:hypothetical protein M7M4_18740 [Corynebacterium pseudogenitalium]